jgi:hypothetical protein
MDFLLMTSTAYLPVHGLAYPAATLKPFLLSASSSWLVPATRPHVCCVNGCDLMRAHLRGLWARVARRATRRHVAHLALARVLPSDIAGLILRFLRDAKKKHR